MTGVRLIHGDCLQEMSTIQDGSVDMILCDLPYGTTACKWDTVIPFPALWSHYKRLVKRNGAIVLTASQPFTSLLVCSNLEWFKYELVWAKSQGTSAGLAKVRPMPAHENILVFGATKIEYSPQMRTGFAEWKRRETGTKLKNEHGYGYSNPAGFEKRGGNVRYPLSVLPINAQKGCSQQLHPTQKPVALMEYLIRTYTHEGDTVLDNTMGSGTTGVACVQTGRNFVGIEKDADYFCIASKRIADAQAQIMLTI